jgi:hypothetical protein
MRIKINNANKIIIFGLESKDRIYNIENILNETIIQTKSIVAISR